MEYPESAPEEGEKESIKSNIHYYLLTIINIDIILYIILLNLYYYLYFLPDDLTV